MVEKKRKRERETRYIHGENGKKTRGKNERERIELSEKWREEEEERDSVLLTDTGDDRRKRSNGTFDHPGKREREGRRNDTDGVSLLSASDSDSPRHGTPLPPLVAIAPALLSLSLSLCCNIFKVLSAERARRTRRKGGKKKK